MSKGEKVLAVITIIAILVIAHFVQDPRLI